MNRLFYILEQESEIEKCDWEAAAIEYIAKIADGGLRDAITLMDKCLSYSTDLTLENVVKALGVADYETMFNLNECIFYDNSEGIINIVTDVFNSGVDLKLFIKNYFEFVLDLNIYCITDNLSCTKIPSTWLDTINSYREGNWDRLKQLLKFITDLQSEIKWVQNPKSLIIAKFMLFVEE